MATTNPNNYIPGTNFPKAPLPVYPDPSVPNNYEAGYEAKKAFSKAYENAMKEEYGYNPDPMADFDVETRRNESQKRLAQMEKEIRDGIRGSYYDRQQTYQGLASGIQSSTSSKGMVGGMKPISVNSAYNILPSGTMIPKTKTYIEGINNEDALARTQTNAEKRWNGLGKLFAKTGLNVLGNTVGSLYSVGAWFFGGDKEGFIDNNFNRWLDEQNKKLDYYLPHYYTEEAKKENFLQRITTANGFWNDLLGNALPFTLSTMLTMYGMGAVGLSKLGTGLARASMGWKVRRAAAEQVKASLGTLKRSAAIGRKAGDMASSAISLAPGVMYESSTEALNTRLDADDRFRNYIMATTGRAPTAEEMADFRKKTEGAVNGVFWANTGIVGLSDWLLFAKMTGLGKTFWGKKISDTVTGGSKFINRKLFGLGARRSTTNAGQFEAIKANFLQKSLRTAWNVAKRPLSEGMFEEGFQGVAQRTAEEFIDSRYNKMLSRQNVGFWDAVRQSFADQYTSKEGWMEIGMGALIGAMFGARSGFGVFEASRQQDRINQLVEGYNANNAFSPGAISDLARQTMIVNSQIKARMDSNGKDVTPYIDVMAGAQEDMFNKFRLSEELGMLDEHAEDMREALDKLDVADLAKELNITEERAGEYKSRMKESYDDYLDKYKESRKMTDDILPSGFTESYKTYVAKTIFDGMDAQSNISVLSDNISEMMGRTEFAQYLKDAAKFSRTSYEVGEELKSKMKEIQDLQEELDRMAADRPKAGDPDQASVESKIQSLTGQIEKLRKEYAEAEERAVQKVSADFNEADFLDVSNTLSTGTPSSITGESILAAVDMVDAIDDRIAEARKGGRTGVSDEALSEMAKLYRDNAVALKRAINLVSSLTDEQFRDSSYTRFREIEENGRKRFFKIDTKDRDLAENISSVDGKIDQMLNEGRITEEEANGMKFFNHLRDGITRESSSLNEFVNRGVRDSLMQRDDLENLTPEESAVLERLARKVSEGIESLTPYEDEIYKKFKGQVDSMAKTMGGELKNALERLKKLNDLVKNSEDKGYLNDLRSYILDGASKAEREEFDKAEKAYRSLLKDKKATDEQRSEAAGKLNDLAARHGFTADYASVVEADEAGNEDVGTSTANAPRAGGTSATIVQPPAMPDNDLPFGDNSTGGQAGNGTQSPATQGQATAGTPAAPSSQGNGTAGVTPGGTQTGTRLALPPHSGEGAAAKPLPLSPHPVAPAPSPDQRDEGDPLDSSLTSKSFTAYGTTPVGVTEQNGEYFLDRITMEELASVNNVDIPDVSSQDGKPVYIFHDSEGYIVAVTEVYTKGGAYKGLLVSPEQEDREGFNESMLDIFGLDFSTGMAFRGNTNTPYILARNGISSLAVLGSKPGDTVSVFVRKRNGKLEFYAVRDGETIGEITGKDITSKLRDYAARNMVDPSEGSGRELFKSKVKRVDFSATVPSAKGTHRLSDREKGMVEAVGYMLDGEFHLSGGIRSEDVNPSLMYGRFRAVDGGRRAAPGLEGVKIPVIVLRTNSGTLAALEVGLAAEEQQDIVSALEDLDSLDPAGEESAMLTDEEKIAKLGSVNSVLKSRGMGDTLSAGNLSEEEINRVRGILERDRMTPDVASWPSLTDTTAEKDLVLTDADIENGAVTGGSTLIYIPKAVEGEIPSGAKPEQDTDGISDTGARPTGRRTAGTRSRRTAATEERESRAKASGHKAWPEREEFGKDIIRMSADPEAPLNFFPVLSSFIPGLEDNPAVATVMDRNRWHIAFPLFGVRAKDMFDWACRMMGFGIIKINTTNVTLEDEDNNFIRGYKILGLYNTPKKKSKKGGLSVNGLKYNFDTVSNVDGKNRGGTLWHKAEVLDVAGVAELVKQSAEPVVVEWRKQYEGNDEALKDAVSTVFVSALETVAKTGPSPEGKITFSPYKMIAYSIGRAFPSGSLARDITYAIKGAYQQVWNGSVEGKQNSITTAVEGVDLTRSISGVREWMDAANEKVRTGNDIMKKYLGENALAVELEAMDKPSTLDEVETDIENIRAASVEDLAGMAYGYGLNSPREIFDILEAGISQMEGISDEKRNELSNKISGIYDKFISEFKEQVENGRDEGPASEPDAGQRSENDGRGQGEGVGGGNRPGNPLGGTDVEGEVTTETPKDTSKILNNTNEGLRRESEDEINKEC